LITHNDLGHFKTINAALMCEFAPLTVTIKRVNTQAGRQAGRQAGSSLHRPQKRLNSSSSRDLYLERGAKKGFLLALRGSKEEKGKILK
jgi:hypothetical protein